ncbi:non-ribosomal peptide synthetase, partial [Streptomyces tateyamensis]
MTALPTGPAALDPGDQRRALLERLLATGRGTAAPLDTIPRAPRQGPLPLSFAQQRLWLLENLRPGTAEYVVPIGWRLDGPLDVPALRRALDALLQRHEVLRTRYQECDSVPGQLPLPAGELDFTLVDLGEPDQDLGERRLAELVDAQARTPFDLGGRGPVRAELVRFTDQHHVLLLIFHHIAFDGASAGLLARELDQLYRTFTEGDGRLPAAPAIQYGDFASWQRRPGAEAALAGHLAYWREQLAGAEALELAADRPRPAVFDPAGALHAFTVPAALARSLAEFGRSRGATPFMVLLAAFQLLLARHAGRTDVTVGSPVAGRTRAEVRELIGFF